jgi:hypothetical protein
MKDLGFSFIAFFFMVGHSQAAASPHDDLVHLTPIEQIAVHQLVWAQDESTGEVAKKRVMELFKTHPDHLHHVSIDTDGDGQTDETLSGTAEHPFWDQDASEWVRMGDLKPGTRLHLLNREGHTASQTPAYVLDNQRQNAPPGETFTTYNFEVEDFHTYFVGDGGVWVHNFSKYLCDDAFSLFTESKRKLNISDADLPGKRLDIVEDGWRVSGPLPGNGPGHVLHALQREEFADFAAGKFGIGRLKTYNQQKAMLAGKGAGDLYDVHHVAEKWLSKRLGINLTDKQLDDLTPGIALPKSPKTFGAHEANYRNTFGHDPIYHGGELVEGSLVQKLGEIRRRFDDGLIEGQGRGLLNEVKALYESPPYDQAKMWPVTRDWLKSKVADPSVVPD